jgi:hypothetical protein
VATADFFVDPRLTQSVALSLAPLNTGTPALPLVGPDPAWVVPSETSSVAVASFASVPAMFDFEPVPGDPDIASAGPGSAPMCSKTALASYTPPGERVTPGVWIAAPTECGPYTGFSPEATDAIGITAYTRAFDPAVSSTTGDAWIGAVNPLATFTPLVLAPGQTGTINVTFTPSGGAGTVVSGDLFVDTLENDVPPPAYAQSTGDELAAVPYQYQIAAGG